MKRIFLISVLIFSVFSFPFSVKTQVRPVYDYGAIGLGQLLKKLQTTKSVIMIGAHPDDEDSALLAFLARGENARTAYLSLTRGDGGQNLLGDELFESLGVIRTEELLQARRLDGAEQYFTRAFDYGFSKTLEEAKSKWDEKIILCDAVRAIRKFRPLVVIARFSGTPADGHGQHQYAGYIAPLAVKAAADSSQCQNTGQEWKVQKFYVEQGFRSTAEPSLRVNSGEYDFLLGRSYAEIAAEGRSQHKTQEQGGLEVKGDRFSGLNLIEAKETKAEKEISVFDGIDVSINGIAAISSNSQNVLKEKLSELQKIVEELSTQNSGPDKMLDLLVKGYKQAESAEWSTRYPQTKFFLQEKQREFRKAILLASGLQIDALSNRETITANEKFQTNVKVFYPKNESLKIKEIRLESSGNWQISKAEPPKEQTQNSFFREVPKESALFDVLVSENAKPSAPYWLKEKRNGEMFVWENLPELTEPFSERLLEAKITAEINGTNIEFFQPVEYRFADDVRGEIRRELNIVPKISLEFDKDFKLVNQTGSYQSQNAILKITNNSDEVAEGNVYLTLPDGKTAVSLTKAFSLKQKGDRTIATFEIKLPRKLKDEKYEVKAIANINGEKFTQTMNTISYPHIQTHRYYTEVKTAFNILDLKVAPVNVGYIMGSGDKVPQAIEQMGLNVTMLDENELSSGDLSKFDTIVAGIRASQTRPDFVANNKRLFDFMNNGGTLIVQYQQYEYVRANLPPFPAKMDSNIRTVDENAPVKILAPENPVFNFPNKITEKDFEDWVQERNLYTFTSFDEKYIPLLETHDAGEAESKGGLVYAEVGKGKYVYGAYSFFRQLPAGNPGAFRLFANLLSLPKSQKSVLRKN